MKKFDPLKKHMLLSGERRRNLPPEKIIELSKVAPGAIVIDYGCGNGFLTLPLAEAVGSNGKVIACDISEEMLKDLETRAAEDSPGYSTNIVTVLVDGQKIPAEDESVDAVFFVNLLHETENPSELISEAMRVLKPSGRILVVEWKKEKTPQGPPYEERISEDEMKKMLSEANFEIDGSYNFKYHYLTSGKKV